MPNIFVREFQCFFHEFQIQYNTLACASIIENSIAQLIFFTFVFELFVDIVEFSSLLEVPLDSVVVWRVVIDTVCFWVVRSMIVR